MPLTKSLKDVAFRTLAAMEPSPLESLSELRSFLILEHAFALGTAIHATPLIPALRAAVPDATIVVMGSGFGLEIFRENPGVDAIIPIPSPFTSVRASAKELGSHLSGQQMWRSATVTPMGNERSAIALSARLAGARNRVGFTLVPQLYRAPLVFDPALSQIANNLRIVEALGHPPAQHYEPQVFFAPEDLSYAESLLGEFRDVSRPLAVFVTQTSPTQRKSWRAERFVAAAQFLVDHHGADVVFVGTAAESAAIDVLREPIRGRTWNVAGRTDLQQLAALLSLCSVGLTLDTGTMHIGRAVGLPMVIVAPAWSPPVEWLPVGNLRYTILKNAEMPEATPEYIIDEVSVDEVTAALADLLARYPRG